MLFDWNSFNKGVAFFSFRCLARCTPFSKFFFSCCLLCLTHSIYYLLSISSYLSFLLSYFLSKSLVSCSFLSSLYFSFLLSVSFKGFHHFSVSVHCLKECFNLTVFFLRLFSSTLSFYVWSHLLSFMSLSHFTTLTLSHFFYSLLFQLLLFFMKFPRSFILM